MTPKDKWFYGHHDPVIDMMGGCGDTAIYGLVGWIQDHGDDMKDDKLLTLEEAVKIMFYHQMEASKRR